MEKIQLVNFSPDRLRVVVRMVGYDNELWISIVSKVFVCQKIVGRAVPAVSAYSDKSLSGAARPTELCVVVVLRMLDRDDDYDDEFLRLPTGS